MVGHYYLASRSIGSTWHNRHHLHERVGCSTVPYHIPHQLLQVAGNSDSGFRYSTPCFEAATLRCQASGHFQGSVSWLIERPFRSSSRHRSLPLPGSSGCVKQSWKMPFPQHEQLSSQTFASSDSCGWTTRSCPQRHCWLWECWSTASSPWPRSGGILLWTTSPIRPPTSPSPSTAILLRFWGTGKPPRKSAEALAYWRYDAERGCSETARKEQEVETAQKGSLGFLFVVK